jgi:hypothetical protein
MRNDKENVIVTKQLIFRFQSSNIVKFLNKAGNM